MFSFFKPNPHKKLQKQYEQLVNKAFLAQRNGDIRGYSLLTDEAEQVLSEIEKLSANNKDHENKSVN